MTFPGCHSKISINIGGTRTKSPSERWFVAVVGKAEGRAPSMLGFHFGIPGGPWKAGSSEKMEKSWISTVLAEDIYMWKNISCVYFFENTRAWNRMQEMDMVRLSMIFIAMGIRVGSTYIVEIIQLMFKTTAASIWPLSQYG